MSTRRPFSPPKVEERPLACPDCGSKNLRTASKTIDAATYWSCGTCGAIWNAARREQAGRYGSARR